MFKRLLRLSALLCALSILCSCATPTKAPTESNEPQYTNTSLQKLPSPLPKSEDAGQKYIDSFIFIGESTTYHLKSRGVLSGGTDTTQVWAPKSGTLMLDATTANCRIVYPETGEEIDLTQAAARKKPEYFMLSFGLNGATRSISKGKDYFKSSYKKLIDTLLSSSKNSKIILQSCFPVAKNMDMSNFSVDVSTLNRYIDTLNSWTQELADENGFAYLNTSEILKDQNGFLLFEYQSGDGYHLTREAYIEILKYIRTHAYVKKENI